MILVQYRRSLDANASCLGSRSTAVCTEPGGTMLLAALTTAIGVFQPAPCALEGVPADFEQNNAIECG